MTHKSNSTEVDAYIWIKQNLKEQGWDVRNPERIASGQVYTQNECLANPEIKKLFGQKHPENIVKVTEKVLWVIEAKKTHGEIKQALNEAVERAKTLNKSKRFQCKFISGVAGNTLDTFIARTHFLCGHKFVPVELNDIEATGLLSQSQLSTILQQNDPNIKNPQIDEKVFLSRANRINKILHLGAINPHNRAGVMAALLLSKISDTGPNIEERNLSVLIGDINNRVEAVLKDQGKIEFLNYIKIDLPASKDNHFKFRKALVDTIQELDSLNIKSAMNSGDDWLGTFYEVFLKYANWAQDLGIVLTPRHITKWAANTLDVQTNDIVYDPCCGTGGFLVAAFDYVKAHSNPDQIGKFKRNSVFGIEQDDGIAALAVVNMIFRGDGKNNIMQGDCFAKFLEPSFNIDDKKPTAAYSGHISKEPPITKIMMNPPFPAKGSGQKEYKFIDQALAQMQPGCILFSILPYPAMVKSGAYLSWRKDILMTNNTLLAVVTFPIDIFYPIGVTTVGVFIRKGMPHPKNQNVLWIRALSDGYLKSKGKRLPSSKAANDLEKTKDLIKSFIHNPNLSVTNVNQLQRSMPIDFDDIYLELVPEVYLEEEIPNESVIKAELEVSVRNTLAYLVKINRAIIKSDLLERPTKMQTSIPAKWVKFKISQIFDLHRGNFHSIAALDSGSYPTVSRIGADCGLVGFYDKPDKAIIWSAGTITVSTVTGDAFLQPVPFIATDNVVLCTKNRQYEELKLTSLYFITLMLNMVKWRYSYGRECYKTKYAKTEVYLPVTDSGILDESCMKTIVENAAYWPLVEAVFNGKGN